MFGIGHERQTVYEMPLLQRMLKSTMLDCEELRILAATRNYNGAVFAAIAMYGKSAGSLGAVNPPSRAVFPLLMTTL